jgi:WD40 repeat protein
MSVAFSPTGNLIASSGQDFSINFWDPDTGRLLKSIKDKEITAYNPIRFSADGRLLIGSATTGFPKRDSIKIWDVASGELVNSLAEGTRNTGMVFDSQKRVVTVLGGQASSSFALTAWSLETSKEISTIPVGLLKVGNGSLELSPRGDYLALTVAINEVALASVSSGQVERTLKTSLTENLKLAFSADGALLAVGALGRLPSHYISSGEYGNTPEDYYGQVEVWKIATGERIAKFTWRKLESVTAVAFSPNGRRLAIASRDEIRIWDVQQAQPVQILRGHQPTSIAYSRDGRRLISGGGGLDSGIALPFLMLWNVAESE